MNKHAKVLDLAGEARDLIVVRCRRQASRRQERHRGALADRRRLAWAASRSERQGCRRGRQPRARGLPRMARRAGAEARRAGPPARRGAARRQGRPRPPRHDRGRQDRLRGPRRSAGDDRHLRLRGRPVAPALRPDHRHRARRAPHDGDLASARRRRRHLGLQLPGRGLVVERGARAGLRQSASSGSRRRRRR